MSVSTQIIVALLSGLSLEAVAEQLLARPNVIIGLEQMTGPACGGMTKGMSGRPSGTSFFNIFKLGL